MPQQPCIGSFKDLATFWRAVNNASEAKGDGQTGGYAQRRIVNLQTVQQQKPLCREAERLLMQAEDAQHKQDPTVPNFPECGGHCKHGVRCTNTQIHMVGLRCVIECNSMDPCIDQQVEEEVFQDKAPKSAQVIPRVAPQVQEVQKGSSPKRPRVIPSLPPFLRVRQKVAPEPRVVPLEDEETTQNAPEVWVQEEICQKVVLPFPVAPRDRMAGRDVIAFAGGATVESVEQEVEESLQKNPESCEPDIAQQVDSSSEDSDDEESEDYAYEMYPKRPKVHPLAKGIATDIIAEHATKSSAPPVLPLKEEAAPTDEASVEEEEDTPKAVSVEQEKVSLQEEAPKAALVEQEKEKAAKAASVQEKASENQMLLGTTDSL